MLLDLDRVDVFMLPFAGAMCPAKRDGEYDQQALDTLAMGNMSIFKIKPTFLEATKHRSNLPSFSILLNRLVTRLIGGND